MTAFATNSIENFVQKHTFILQDLSVSCQSLSLLKRLQALCLSAFCQSVSLFFIFFVAKAQKTGLICMITGKPTKL